MVIEKMNIVSWLNIILLFVGISSMGCDKIKEYGRSNTKKKMESKKYSEKDIEKWKERLNLTEAEIQDLDKSIRKLIKKTNEAGTLSWRIAKNYLKTGNYELGVRHYQQALEENASGQNLPDSQIHKYESSLLYWDKALLYKSLNEDLLFEAGLAYSNAARDRGWEKQRTEIAVDIFKSLVVKNPDDHRYPYQLALILFDSTVSSQSIETLPDASEKIQQAFRLLNQIIKKDDDHPSSIPARFAKANFLFRMGKVEEARTEYKTIQLKIEGFHSAGVLREKLEELQSYKNAIENIKKIDELVK
jgi:tetratricopeptide (TPR) repeat protein